MEKILITGVGGFIGSHVATRFIQEGFSVVGVDDFSSGDINNVPAGVELIEGDLARRSTISRLPPNCKRILHLAGQSSGEISFDDPISDLEKNTTSTLNLIRYGIDNSAERLIYASSMSVYGTVDDTPIDESRACCPLSCYGVGKHASENYLRIYQNKLPFVILRMFNVYGPRQNLSNLRQGMVSIFLAQALKNGKIQVKGSVDRFRDIIYIDDVVETWFRSTFEERAKGKTLNVGTGIKTTIGALLQKVCCLVPGSSYHIDGETPGDQNGIYSSNAALKSILDINAFTSLDEGLFKFFTWARETQVSGPSSN